MTPIHPDPDFLALQTALACVEQGRARNAPALPIGRGASPPAEHGVR